VTTVRNAFTVDVEEYFQVEAFSGHIDRRSWDRLPSRAMKQTGKVLELLDEFHVRGTFFVLGWLAERNPGLIRDIRDAGHEIASHGFEHRMISKMTPEEFRGDVRKSKEILEGIAGAAIEGYRAPTFSILEKTSWAYEILLHEGFRYSSSVYPIWHDRYGWPGFGHRPRKMAANEKGEIWEVPMTVGSIGPIDIPFGGGGYLRAYPLSLTKAFFRILEKKGRSAILYIHPWELDTDHPPVKAPFLKRLRHFFGIERMERKLTDLLRTKEFGTVAELVEASRNGARLP
jgi:polysaccharide deacetylase family protein (PEP-CTERM system associated)